MAAFLIRSGEAAGETKVDCNPPAPCV